MRNLVSFGGGTNPRLGCFPDSAAGDIHDAGKGDIVFFVHEQAEISEHVLHFFALIEAETPIDAIRDTVGRELGFKGARHIGRAIEYGDVVIP